MHIYNAIVAFLNRLLVFHCIVFPWWSCCYDTGKGIDSAHSNRIHSPSWCVHISRKRPKNKNESYFFFLSDVTIPHLHKSRSPSCSSLPSLILTAHLSSRGVQRRLLRTQKTKHVCVARKCFYERSSSGMPCDAIRATARECGQMEMITTTKQP